MAAAEPTAADAERDPAVNRETPAHAAIADVVAGQLSVDTDRGLEEREVEARRETHGPNRLRSAERRSALKILAEQLASVVLIILAVAAGLAVALAHWTEAIAIAAVLLVNAAIGFVSEWRAVRTMEALQRLDRRRATVRREGREREVPTEELVPGDVVLVKAEDVVPADLRILTSDNLRVEEATLTGESVPVAKLSEPVDADAPLAERTSMLYKGTSIAEGTATAVVVATGMDTELGAISSLAEGASTKSTPLQRSLDRLGRRLAWLTVGLAGLVAGVGLLAGQPRALMVETAIALGVAAIPEGLPIVATIALARGMWVMARRQAVVNRLTAVETLGSTRIIFSDKTGTLTENRMRVVHLATEAQDHELEPDGEGPDDLLARRMLEVSVLCNNASLDDGGHGDPTEVALLEAGRRAGLERNELLETLPEVREESFDPSVMMMATFHREEGGFRVAVKGAPAAVIDASASIAVAADDEREMSDDERERWLACNRSLAGDGLRVLALAERRADDDSEEPYRDLRLLGLVGLIDPPRKGVREAIKRCQDSGMRVVMVTGDQPDTARAVARQIGLEVADGQVVHGSDLEDLAEHDPDRMASSAVFARVSPGQKLRLVELFQDRGETVAMTGDGVNDAPALKQADIGVAMGQRGTDAARQVSDMVLRDDALDTIVAAVRQGRIIFSNIRRSVMFMLCTNVAEVIAVAVASAATLPLPLKPLQILYLNVLTDVFPALALGLGRGDPDVMERPPRPADEPVLTRSSWIAIGGWSTVIAACVLGALGVALTWLGLETEAAVTVSFLTLAFAKLWFVFNLTEPGSPLVDNDVVRNPWVWGSIAICVGLLLAAVYVPPLAEVLATRRPGPTSWLTVLAFSGVPFVIGQSIRGAQRLRRRGEDR